MSASWMRASQPEKGMEQDEWQEEEEEKKTKTKARTPQEIKLDFFFFFALLKENCDAIRGRNGKTGK